MARGITHSLSGIYPQVGEVGVIMDNSAAGFTMNLPRCRGAPAQSL